jgi:hypothetical protein
MGNNNRGMMAEDLPRPFRPHGFVGTNTQPVGLGLKDGGPFGLKLKRWFHSLTESHRLGDLLFRGVNGAPSSSRIRWAV